MTCADWLKVATLAMALAVAQAHASPITADQESTGATNFSGSGGKTNAQSFTPTFDRIDAAEFLLRSDGPGSTVRLEIRAGAGLGGTLLGQSAQVAVGSALSIIHFDLLNSIDLTAGDPYSMVLVLTGGSTFAGDISALNPYAGGMAFDNTGSAFGSFDFWFREGTHIAQVPEPSAYALVALALSAAGWSRRHKKVHRA